MRKKEETDIRQLFDSLSFTEQQEFFIYCCDYLKKRQVRFVDAELGEVCRFCIPNASTGARDANGVEIHEGDILHECSTGLVFTVIWNKDTCAFALREPGFPESGQTPLGIMVKNHKYNIVGNIHYNSKKK